MEEQKESLLTEQQLKRLINEIIGLENERLRTRKKSENAIIKEIKDIIEEKVQCCLKK